MNVSVLATNLGFPRVGLNRELKKALEGYWKGQTTREQLLATGAELRARHWKLQQQAGIDHIPSNDFSLYDHIHDLSCLLGNVPRRYGWQGGDIDLDTYFAMARGRQVGGVDVTAMEMSKWFDTNYHYLVPEFEADPVFKLSSTKVFDEYREARALGVETRPVLVGPLTYARIGKKREGADYSRSTLLARLAPVYIEVLQRLAKEGATWVQIDEPALALDLPERYRDATLSAYRQIAAAVPGIRILLTTYFDGLRDNTGLTFRCRWPVSISTCVVARARPTPRRTTPTNCSAMRWTGSATACCRWVSSMVATSGRTTCASRCCLSRAPWKSWARAALFVAPPAVRCCTCRSTWRPRRSSIPADPAQLAGLRHAEAGRDLEHWRVARTRAVLAIKAEIDAS